MDFVNDDGENFCPLCMEEMDLTDRQLKPCKCGYEICVWCWHQVMEVAEKDNTEGRCPACRTPYDKEKIVGMTVSCDRLDMSSEKRQKSQKSKTKASEMRKHLSNVRVIQRNLVYIIGIPSNLADEETLERREFFGQYGKVLKVSISKPSASNQHSSSNPTSSVYITYMKEEEAIRCIQVVNGYVLDGRPLKACFGTTKYCHAWLKNMPCNNPDCLYLHDIGTQEDSFTKEEMVSTCASKIPQFHGPTNSLQRRGGSCLPPPEPEVCSTNLASSSKPSVKTVISNVGGHAKTTVANGSTGKATALPAAASWGLRVTQGKSLPTKAPIIPVSTKLKSSSSHTLSVSPPSNLPTSAAVVVAAAATPLLHSDHIQSSLGVVSCNGSQTSLRSPCSLTSKQNMKNHQTRTNLTNGAAVDSSAVTAISEKHIREDSPERRPSESHLQQNHGFQEALEKASDISLQNSSLTGNSHVQSVGIEKLEYASVSSGLRTRRLSQDGSINFHNNFDDISTSTSNESSRAFHGSFNASKLPLDASTVSANLLQSDSNTLDEKFMVEPMKEFSVSDIEDHCISTEPEEQCPGSVAQMLSETGRFLKHGSSLDANKRPFLSWRSTTMAESCSANTAISKDDSSTVLSLETSNLDILNGNSYKIGTVDGKSDFSRARSEGSILTHPFQDVGITEDRIIRVNVPASEQIAEGNSILAKSQYVERHENDKTHIRHNSGTDAGEDNIISDILKLNIDIWEDDSITSPHDVVTKALLGEKEKVNGLPKDISSLRKLQNSGQSRFSFARHDGSSGESSQSSKSLVSSGQFPDTWSKGKDTLDERVGYDQVNRSLNDRTAFDQEEYQMLSNRTAPPPLSGSTVAPPSVSRSQFSAPPGFSVPTRAPQVPPPGFFPQSRVERPYEPPTTTVFSNGTKDHNEAVLSQNAFSNSYPSLHQTLGVNNSNDVEFIDPAIMAVGKGKFPIGQIQRGSAGPDSVFSGPRQDLSDSSFSQSFLGLRSPFPQQVSSADYDARLQMLKQKPFYTNSSLTSPRQQFTFQDQIGDISSYLSRQSDAMIPSMMREQSQMNLDSVFSQPSFQQPMNLSFRSSSVGANGWDSWNRMSSALESGLGERNFLEIGNKERMGAWDPKSGLTKLFPTYGESMFHMPCSENYYSRPFEM
ncbi:uncharacterized protein LOC131072939 [Cryptomeria japonica]|uniref:uncharacterized protein LOC131072939 n=1 Tax=Cryptomeria japonica TaxID=3369 RepID=UPI0027DA1E0F|nr:uncharacterized protein LOC131072939 [Cryptomeria japonica]XP_057865228.2 uncharacterized protein LOC131072939 [Cryptomeria japonica]